MKNQIIISKENEWKSVEDIQIAHLAGVFDAIGSIRLSVIKDSDYRIDYNLRPSLILLRPDRDDPVLGKLMQYSEECGIKYSIIEQSHGKDGSVSLQWTVQDIENVRLALEPMMKYLVTKFFPAELMLTEILPALENEKHRSKDGFYEIMGLSDKLREYKSDYGNVKYTQKYFAEEWEEDLSVV